MEAEAVESAGRESRVELFTQQQQLINQYMHLNIQLLSKKLSNLEQIEKLPKTEEQEHHNDLKSSKKKMYFLGNLEKK
jgi:DNA-binding protein H-NS